MRSPIATPALELLASWCLSGIGINTPNAPPALIGVVPDLDVVRFHVIDLDPGDPVGDLRDMVAPPHWPMVGVVARVIEEDGHAPVAFAHIRSRTGTTFTDVRSRTGAGPKTRAAITRVEGAALGLLEPDPLHIGTCQRRKSAYGPS
ncbi:MAG: hypothetical protein ACR2P0_08025 [Acidimicrobiales bacterium]